MARRKTVAELLAEAYLAKQQAKVARAAAGQPTMPTPVKRPRKPRKSDPEAEQARLLAAGEKILAREDEARARQAMKVEADLAKRQAARTREAQANVRARDQAEREQQRLDREAHKQHLKDEAERRTERVMAVCAELAAVLRERPAGLEDWHPLVERALARDGAKGVAEVVGDLLRRSPVPEGCRDAVEVGYFPEAAQLRINVGLPSLAVVPTVASYRLVVQRLEIVAQPVKEVELQLAYRILVGRLALRALDEAFSVTPPGLVEEVALNGFVATTDPATGRAVRPCVVSVVALREEFSQLVLDAPTLDPQLCLHTLGAVVSQHPHDLEPVPPVVEFDPQRFKLARDVAAVTGLDSRKDLLEMDPYAFERLVRELFEAMGYETWRTQNSRDDGLDAVAVKRDSVGVTVVAVQAKRTKNAVPLETVRALLGTVADTDAARGVLVTTSWFGKASYDLAARNGDRLFLIEGRQLKSLLLEYLGIDALIGLPKLPRSWRASGAS
ncbi:restriction endonuclease [Kitasatospora sp. NPDC101157]|uniref:restriction endonuclease n=1 Tax=Kitasatospora sp. NPDC101157 TaxID=3364098 RepID=UPI00380CA23E